MSRTDPVGPMDPRTKMLGSSPRFRHAVDRLARYAQIDAAVLIVGETGTGKELAARALHYLGRRRDRAFIPLNCASLPDGLVESELFGHAGGAFTDARRAHRGLVAQAEGGTLFLDEVEALSPQAQASLLRFLQDSSYRPVGGEDMHRADVRVVSASNVDLLTQVRTRSFREDLLYRLDVLKVELPPLRERVADIDLLADHLLQKAAKNTGQGRKTLDERAAAALRAYAWPGNVRQLEHTMLRVHLLCESATITVADLAASLPELAGHPVGAAELPAPLLGAGGQALPTSLTEAKRIAVHAVESSFISSWLSRAAGNISEAARLCGMQRASFSRLAKKHGVGR